MRVLLIDIKSEMQTCLMASAQLLNEIEACKLGGYSVLKVIHGYGSHGVGGAIKKEIHSVLKTLKNQRKIEDYLPCEKWTQTNPIRAKAIKFSNELLADSDLMMLNPGVTIVLI
ncbi:MAG: Smr/MutS family protein [Clostridia bacterium]|nr:Smr/MutS family protein [Clostridia bacterium]